MTTSSTNTATDHTPRVALTHPDPGPALGGHCKVTVTYGWKPDDEPDLPTVDNAAHRVRYQSRCGGCGHEGPLHSNENTAVEDGCDHAYPGWRELPVMEPRPYEQGKKRARWEAAARQAYPPGWFDRQGPVREYRSSAGTRHVPGHGPGGGYCMAVLRESAAGLGLAQRGWVHPSQRDVQESLFA